MGQTFLVDENCKPTDQTTTIPPKKTKKKKPTQQTQNSQAQET